MGSQIRFAANFRADARALDVLNNAADTLFKLKDYQGAVSAAMNVTSKQPLPSQKQYITAWLITGYSFTELKDYVNAGKRFSNGPQKHAQE